MCGPLTLGSGVQPSACRPPSSWLSQVMGTWGGDRGAFCHPARGPGGVWPPSWAAWGGVSSKEKAVGGSPPAVGSQWREEGAVRWAAGTVPCRVESGWEVPSGQARQCPPCPFCAGRFLSPVQLSCPSGGFSQQRRVWAGRREAFPLGKGGSSLPAALPERRFHALRISHQGALEAELATEATRGRMEGGRGGERVRGL